MGRLKRLCLGNQGFHFLCRELEAWKDKIEKDRPSFDQLAAQLSVKLALQITPHHICKAARTVGLRWEAQRSTLKPNLHARISMLESQVARQESLLARLYAALGEPLATMACDGVSVHSPDKAS